MMKRLGVILLIGVVLVAARLALRDDLENQVLARMRELIADLETYPANAAQLDEWLAVHHPIALDRAYAQGTSHTRANFDQSAYIDSLFKGMAEDAARENLPDVADELDQLRDEVELVPAGP